MTMNLFRIEATGSALTAEKIRLELSLRTSLIPTLLRTLTVKSKRKEVAFEEYIKSPERRVAGF